MAYQTLSKVDWMAKGTEMNDDPGGCHIVTKPLFR